MCSTNGYTSSSTPTLGLLVSIPFKTVDTKTLWIPWPIDIYTELLSPTKPLLPDRISQVT